MGPFAPGTHCLREHVELFPDGGQDLVSEPITLGARVTGATETSGASRSRFVAKREGRCICPGPRSLVFEPAPLPADGRVSPAGHRECSLRG